MTFKTSDAQRIIKYSFVSITRRWVTDGLPVFEQYYESLGVANYGIGGELVQNVLWRILNGEIDGLNPKLVVLKIGTNNLGNNEILSEMNYGHFIDLYEVWR